MPTYDETTSTATAKLTVALSAGEASTSSRGVRQVTSKKGVKGGALPKLESSEVATMLQACMDDIIKEVRLELEAHREMCRKARTEDLKSTIKLIVQELRKTGLSGVPRPTSEPDCDCQANRRAGKARGGRQKRSRKRDAHVESSSSSWASASASSSEAPTPSPKHKRTKRKSTGRRTPTRSSAAVAVLSDMNPNMMPTAPYQMVQAQQPQIAAHQPGYTPSPGAMCMCAPMVPQMRVANNDMAFTYDRFRSNPFVG